MGPRVRELVVICLLAAFCSGAAWTQDYGFFTAVFAAAAAVAGIEAMRRLR
jgi:hypothetical protein